MITLTETEMMLYSTKWFDYRPYTPDACDLLFLRDWLTAREKMLLHTKLDVRFHEDGTQYRKPFRFTSIEQMKADTDLWNALVMLRQFADRKGMPYNLFWTFAYQVLSEDSIYENEPILLNRPIYLGSIVDQFEEIKRMRIVMSDADNLKGNAYTGLSFQQDYMEYLQAEVHKRYPRSAEEKLAILQHENRFSPPLIKCSTDQCEMSN